jgi:hypothetical protein
MYFTGRETFLFTLKQKVAFYAVKRRNEAQMRQQNSFLRKKRWMPNLRQQTGRSAVGLI